jgi:hypothetical protein
VRQILGVQKGLRQVRSDLIEVEGTCLIPGFGILGRLAKFSLMKYTEIVGLRSSISLLMRKLSVYIVYIIVSPQGYLSGLP